MATSRKTTIQPLKAGVATASAAHGVGHGNPARGLNACSLWYPSFRVGVLIIGQIDGPSILEKYGIRRLDLYTSS
jgi:hypothetical protein